MAPLDALAAWLNYPVAFPMWILPACLPLAGVASYLWWQWWIPEFLDHDSPRGMASGRASRRGR